MSPLGSPATSTQVPWELLWRLLCQVTSRRSLAGIPLRASCMAVPLSLGCTDSLLVHYMLSDARASARANESYFGTSACTYREGVRVRGAGDGDAGCRRIGAVARARRVTAVAARAAAPAARGVRSRGHVDDLGPGHAPGLTAPVRRVTVRARPLAGRSLRPGGRRRRRRPP